MHLILFVTTYIVEEIQSVQKSNSEFKITFNFDIKLHYFLSWLRGVR